MPNPSTLAESEDREPETLTEFTWNRAIYRARKAASKPPAALSAEDRLNYTCERWGGLLQRLAESD